MHMIDEEYLKHPFYGHRRMTKAIKNKGYEVNQKRIRRLMNKLGICGIYPKPKTTVKSISENKIYPYLLKNLEVTKLNQVWASDITYIPIENGYAYMVAIMDWLSRKVLSFKISNTMDSLFCVEALEEALEKYDKPEIFNTDQGSQFTAYDFTNMLIKNNIKISMTSTGRCLDNVFIERLWRSLKYEEVYTNSYSDVKSARKSIARWIEFYNSSRPHQSLDYKPPDQIYFQNFNS